jgi:hypothetical protein
MDFLLLFSTNYNINVKIEKIPFSFVMIKHKNMLSYCYYAYSLFSKDPKHPKKKLKINGDRLEGGLQRRFF